MVFFCLLRRPQQARGPGAPGGAGGQGNTGAGGHRGGNKEALQPANIPVSKSLFLIEFYSLIEVVCLFSSINI